MSKLFSILMVNFIVLLCIKYIETFTLVKFLMQNCTVIQLFHKVVAVIECKVVAFCFIRFCVFKDKSISPMDHNISNKEKQRKR